MANATGSHAADSYECRFKDFVISFNSDLPVGEMPYLLDELNLQNKDNNAFKARCWKENTFSGSFCIAYKPKQDAGCIVDVVLKVHALPENELDKPNMYKPVGPLGFVHTLLHKSGEKVFFKPDIPGRYYLGLTVNENLSTNLRDRMRANKNNDKAYFEGLFDRFKATWHERGDARGKTFARDADYLISYTGHNKKENDELLKRITTLYDGPTGPHSSDGVRSPITFCTDRSLGFGVHFYPRSGGIDDDEGFTLYLGKHGFAQPLQEGTWWNEYRNAAMETKHGILVLNPTPEYFQSKACMKEWDQIPTTRRWVYDRNQDTITSDVVSVLDLHMRGCHPEASAVVGNVLADVLSQEGKHAWGERVRQDACLMQRIGSISQMTNLEEAERFLRDALPKLGQKGIFGIDYVTACIKLADVLSQMAQMDKLVEAEHLLRHVLQAWSVVGRKGVLTTNIKLANVLGQMGKLEEAERIYYDLLHGEKSHLRLFTPDSVTTCLELADLLGHMGRLAEAERFLRAAFRKQEVLKGKGHLETESISVKLTELLEQMGKLAEVSQSRGGHSQERAA